VNRAEAWHVELPVDGREMQTARKEKSPKMRNPIASALVWWAKARDYSPVVVFLREKCEPALMFPFPFHSTPISNHPVQEARLMAD